MIIDTNILLLLVLIPPFISFALNGLLPFFRGSKKISSGISILAISISTFSSLVLIKLNPNSEVTFTWIPLKTFSDIKFGFFLDPAVLIMFLIVSLVSLAVQVYSIGYLSSETPRSYGRYYTFQSLFAFSMLGFVASSSLLQIYVFWELIGLCSYLLIGFWFERPEASRAALKAFWITRLGDVGFAIGIVLLWGATGTFLLPELINKTPELSKGFLALCLVLIFMGAMGKSAQFPLHVWLPDAMEGPTPVSALIHAATMVVAGVYLVFRLFPLFELTPDVLVYVLWIGTITALLGASLALVQNDLKRILAYSTVSQVGYMISALGAGGKGIAFFHLFTHAFFKALLFLAAGCLIHSLNTNNIWDMGRLMKKMPQVGTLFLVGALALSGVFPFSGHFSKDEILMWMHSNDLDIHFIILLFTAFITSFYMFRAFFVVFFGRQDVKAYPHNSPLVMTTPMWILAILTLVGGFQSEKFFNFIGVMEESNPSYISFLPLLLSIAGIVVAWLFYQVSYFKTSTFTEALSPIKTALDNKLWIDDFYHWIYIYIINGLAYICGWFDRYIVDGFVNFVASYTMSISHVLRNVQTGRAQDYLYGIIIAILLFSVLSSIKYHFSSSVYYKETQETTSEIIIQKGSYRIKND